jgi:hypothetical protein
MPALGSDTVWPAKDQRREGLDAARKRERMRSARLASHSTGTSTEVNKS